MKLLSMLSYASIGSSFFVYSFVEV